MKSFMFVFLFVSTIVTVNAQTFTDPVKYNDYIIGQQNLIVEKILVFIGKFNEEDMTEAAITPVLEDLLNVSKVGVSTMKQLTSFEGDTQLRQSALELFQFYVQTIDQDYREMVNLLYGDEMDDATIARLNDLVQKVQADEALYDEKFLNAQKAFAEKYDIELQANDLQDKLDKN